MSNRNLSESLAADHTVIARTITPKSISTTNSGRKDLEDFLTSNSNQVEFPSFEEEERELYTTSSEEVLGEEPTLKDDKTKGGFWESIRQIDTIVLVALVLLFIFVSYVAYKSGLFKIGK